MRPTNDNFLTKTNFIQQQIENRKTSFSNCICRGENILRETWWKSHQQSGVLKLRFWQSTAPLYRINTGDYVNLEKDQKWNIPVIDVLRKITQRDTKPKLP